MGSARVSNAKPIPMETTKKKARNVYNAMKTSLIELIAKKKDKPNNEKKKNVDKKTETKEEVKETPNTSTVDTIVEDISNLSLKEKQPEAQIPTVNDDDERNNFTIDVIEVPRVERIHSQTSDDSGFLETKETENVDKTEDFDTNEKLDRTEDFDKIKKYDKTEDFDKIKKIEKTELRELDKTNTDDKTENKEKDKDSAENKLVKNEPTDDLAENLKKLQVDDTDKDKKKKKQKVYVPRGPIRNKTNNFTSQVLPYTLQEQDSCKINQINKGTLSGGQVLVNPFQTTDDFSENGESDNAENTSFCFQNDLDDLMDVIKEDTYNNGAVQTNTISNNLPIDYEKTMLINDLVQLLQPNFEMSPQSMPNSVEGLIQEDIPQNYLNVGQTDFSYASNTGYSGAGYAFPTPPRSDAVPSPMSASPASFYPTNSEYSFSPGRSPISNVDNERYQEINHIEEPRERTSSISSMTMKQFKDKQKEIVHNFSKRECCQITRKSCMEIFQEHLKNIKMDVRKHISFEVSKLDLEKQAYKVLRQVLQSLSNSTEKEDLHYVLFYQVCERILGQDPAMFVGDVGLSLLKKAVFCCPQRPILTRYLIQCIRTAIKTNAALVTSVDHVFHEVDALGDTVVTACARAGDRFSDVLSELVRPHDTQPPLFKLRHTNTDGYTALHVACSQHSAAEPKLHTVHVLQVHAGFSITEGDLKGKDTALHLAVNSAHCDLQLILMMFKHVDRKEWKSLAHWPNLSNKTPLDLARLATKTTTRHYPQEVLEFLKKCR